MEIATCGGCEATKRITSRAPPESRFLAVAVSPAQATIDTWPVIAVASLFIPASDRFDLLRHVQAGTPIPGPSRSPMRVKGAQVRSGAASRSRRIPPRPGRRSFCSASTTRQPKTGRTRSSCRWVVRVRVRPSWRRRAPFRASSSAS